MLAIYGGDTMAKDNIVKSLVKALNVLECFVESEPELGVSDIARRLGISKSSTYDIINTFVQMGYMEQNQISQKYSLSVKMLLFSSSVNQHIGYYRVVYDIMDDLAERVNNIVYFSIPHDTDILYLYSSFPKAQRQKFPYRPVTGEICPMYCSSMGKAMLAFSDNNLMERLTMKELKKFTDTTITDFEKLEKEIALVKARGYAFDAGEHQYGVGAVGVPILNKHGKLIAAMSICGTLATFTEENIKLFADLLAEVAFQIQIRL
jgi:IclR family KDG regulon transcriptional repressor